MDTDTKTHLRDFPGLSLGSGGLFREARWASRWTAGVAKSWVGQSGGPPLC